MMRHRTKPDSHRRTDSASVAAEAFSTGSFELPTRTTNRVTRLCAHRAAPKPIRRRPH